MDLLVFLRKIIMSSACKAKWYSVCPMVIPEMLSYDLTANAKGLIAKMNSNGHRGSPCLHPRWTKRGIDFEKSWGRLYLVHLCLPK